MGFWNVMSNMVKGKPVFSDSSSAHSDTVTRGSDASSRKIIPNVIIEGCKSHVDGERIDTTIWIKNASAVDVELDRIELLDMTMALDRRLRPNESREIGVYKGEMPKDDSQDHARLYFTQVRNDDLFCADYAIEFNQESNGRFSLEDFHLQNSIRNI